jgi:hypothetical protein
MDVGRLVVGLGRESYPDEPAIDRDDEDGGGKTGRWARADGIRTFVSATDTDSHPITPLERGVCISGVHLSRLVPLRRKKREMSHSYLFYLTLRRSDSRSPALNQTVPSLRDMCGDVQNWTPCRVR